MPWPMSFVFYHENSLRSNNWSFQVIFLSFRVLVVPSHFPKLSCTGPSASSSEAFLYWSFRVIFLSFRVLVVPSHFPKLSYTGCSESFPKLSCTGCSESFS